jgi:P-type Ca2+ transporter type 2C
MRFEPRNKIGLASGLNGYPEHVVVPTCCGLVVVTRSDLKGTETGSGVAMDIETAASSDLPTNETDSEAATPAYALAADAVLERFSVDPARGLTGPEVDRRHQVSGPNEIERAKQASILTLILRQFVSPVIWLLIAATTVATFYGEFTNAVAIAVVLFLNAAIGFGTEYKAQRSMDAIRRLGETRSRVLRDGSMKMVGSRELVPGDVIHLGAGNVVPADVRLISMGSLQASEAALTGESMPVEKHVAPVPVGSPLAERASMLFKGTAVTRGDCTGVVTATGMETELGHITRLMMGTTEAPSPLEKQLQTLGGQLLWLTIVLCSMIAVIGILSGREVILMIHAGIALAVAAIPEGLPIVATVALAGGMWRMAQRNALVERMAAVETLGSTTVIFTDKTGTLTENRLVAAEAALASGRIALTAKDDHCPAGLEELLEAGALCNHARLKGEGDDEDSGDPLELALLWAARDRGTDIESLRTAWPQTAERPFDSTAKLMVTAHRHDGDFRVACKGAPEPVIATAEYILAEDGTRPRLSKEDRDRWRERAREMAASGLRVLAIAESRGDRTDVDEPADLVLLGLIGFRDPPRRNVPAAVSACQEAGIRVVMVTGDHIATATAISEQVGIPSSAAGRMDGRRLDELLSAGDEGKLEIHESNVFARVSPEHKLRLVERMQAAGEIVAMTGDGVNDAPALRQADIGIAMGQRGTDVAREASDMVLLDDSFPTIVAAIAQGRIIFDNIRRFVVYLLSCNISEVLVVALAILLGLPLALLPLQILFLNLVTDVFPAFALAAGKGDRNILKRPPRPPAELLIGRPQWFVIITYGLTITVTTLIALAIAVRGLGLSPKEATTVSFLTIALAQLLHVFNMRDRDAPTFINDVTRNPWVWAALALCIGLTLLGLYIPPVAAVLQLHPPGASAWAVIIGLSLAPLTIARLADTWLWEMLTAKTGLRLGEG